MKTAVVRIFLVTLAWLILRAVVAATSLAADAPVVPSAGWSVLTIGALCAGIAGVVAAIATAAVKIITAIHDTRRIVVAGQIAAVAAGVVSAEKQQEIHLLVNSNLLTKMRGMLVLLRKEYERTKKDSDREAVELAEAELRETEASALTLSRLHTDRSQDNRDAAGRAELEAAQARAGELPDAQAQLVLALEAVVAGARRDADRTHLPADQALYQQAMDNLARAQKMK